jgi:hypothetical protein
MPRGWLKSQEKSIGRKKCRGGSSYRRKSEGCHTKETLHKKDYHTTRNSKTRLVTGAEFYSSQCIDAFSSFEDEQETLDVALGMDQEEEVLEQCSICCEDRPLISLMKKCDHERACHECLREIYVKQAQESVSNYPLRCYHPSCRKPVHFSPLILNNLFHSKKEIKKHHRLSALGKVYSNTKRNKVVYCPECEEPSKVVADRQHYVQCRHCDTSIYVLRQVDSHISTTLASMHALGTDEKGWNDGLAQCPHCDLWISKGYGCYHMSCVCGNDFDWGDAYRQTESLVEKMLKRKVVVAKSL